MGRIVAVIGGGIIGVAIANLLSSAGYLVSLFEKEDLLGSHQSGSNSGAIHAGPYDKPGSRKA